MASAALSLSRICSLAPGLALRLLALTALAAIAGSAGCAPPPDAECTPPRVKPVPQPAGSARRTAPKVAAPHTLSGADAPSITVKVANATDERLIALEAVHGALDEPLVLLSAKSAGQPAGEAVPELPTEPVAIAISEASLGGETPVPLRLIDALTGEDVTALSLRPGQHAYLRLAGEGFTRDATYRANLTIFDAHPAVYRVRIRSTAPHRPLGLRAAKWSDTFADVPIFQRLAVSVILPVDSAGEDRGPYHVLVRPEAGELAGAANDTKPLPACGISAQRIERDGAILLTLPALEPGRYTGVIEIQGQPLAVDITLKNEFWWVWLFVAAGAGLSLGLREYVRYRAAREATERKIAAKEREIDKKREALFAWDELEARNVLRRARGEKTYFGLDDVDDILPDAAPRERLERVAIDKALSETALPSPVRARLRAQFEALSYLSSREDARNLDRGIVELLRAAQDGFTAALQTWLREVQVHIETVTGTVLPLLQAAPLCDDTKAVERTKAALRVLGALVEDARTLLLDSGLSAGQAEVLSKVEPAIAQIERWVRAKRVPAEIVALIHCDLDSVALPREVAAAPLPPHGLRIRARGVEPGLNAHEEVTFELVAPSGVLDDLPFYEVAQPVAWWIDGREVVPRGSSRMTYVFESPGLWALRPRRVEVRLHRRVLALWMGRVLGPQRSPAFVERLWASSARLGATFVGVIVAGAVAVAVYWSGKAFGGWADYIAAVLTGLGADLTVVAGGGKLLQSVLDTLQKRKKEE